MQKFFELILTIILTLSCIQLKCQTNDETRIYNSLIDSLYEIRTCFRIIDSPYFKCCDVDTLSTEEFMKCCGKSTVPEKYKVQCYRCSDRADFDTLTKLMIVNDSFITLDLRKTRK